MGNNIPVQRVDEEAAQLIDIHGAWLHAREIVAAPHRNVLQRIAQAAGERIANSCWCRNRYEICAASIVGIGISIMTGGITLLVLSHQWQANIENEQRSFNDY